MKAMKAIGMVCALLLPAVPLFSENKTNMSTYPFKITESNGEYDIAAEIESEELSAKYAQVFEKHGYSGNGYCWEGHIIQILEKTDKSLLNHIDFDPEAGAFFAYADSQKSQQRFIEILSPIFSDLKKLEAYILSADRDRIDD